MGTLRDAWVRRELFATLETDQTQCGYGSVAAGSEYRGPVPSSVPLLMVVLVALLMAVVVLGVFVGIYFRDAARERRDRPPASR